MFVSADTLNQIKEIVQKYMNVLMFITTGDNEPSPELLKAMGVPEDTLPVINFVFNYGKLGITSAQDLKNVSLEDIASRVKNVKLSPSQKKALEFINMKAGNEIVNLTNKIQVTVTNSLIQENTSTLDGIRTIIHDGMFEKTVSQVANELREYTKDWNRDWDRVSHSEMWNAKVNGEVMSILEKESPLSQDGEDTLVFKRPAPDACKHCKKHYLEADGVTPKVFKLKDLIANGTNDNKRTSEWLPVVGIMHPNCLCPLTVMPKNCSFDKNGQLQFDGALKKSTPNLHYEQKTITKNGKTYQQGFWVNSSVDNETKDTSTVVNPNSQNKVSSVEINAPKVNDNLMGSNQYTGSGKKIQALINNTTVSKNSPENSNEKQKAIGKSQQQQIHFNQLKPNVQSYFNSINNAGFKYKEFSKVLSSQGRKQALNYLRSHGFNIKDKSTADDTWFSAMNILSCFMSVTGIPTQIK